MINKFTLITILSVLMLLIPSYSTTVDIEILETDPAPIVAGDYAEITFKVTNPSSLSEAATEIRNIEISIDENPFVRYVESDGKSISRLGLGQSATRTFRVYIEDGTPEGFFQVPIKITQDGVDSTYTETFYIQGEDDRAQIVVGKISSAPQELTYDTVYNTLTVELMNIGERDTELTRVELKEVEESIQPSYSYSMQDQIGTIENGEVSEVEFVVDILESVRDYVETTLVVTYREEVRTDEFEVVTVELPIVIDLAPLPDFEILSVEQLTDFQHETVENKIKVRFKNIGNQKAEDVRVRIVPDKSYPFIFEETTLYAQSQVDIGEEFEVIYLAEVTAGDPKMYQLRLDVESLVHFDKYIEKEYIEITTVQGEDNFNSNYLMIIFGIIVVVSLFIGFRNFRSSKKEDEELKSKKNK